VLAHVFGRRVLCHQLAHGLAQQALLFGEAEIHDVSLAARRRCINRSFTIIF
jgi:hypothetical protein